MFNLFLQDHVSLAFCLGICEPERVARELANVPSEPIANGPPARPARAGKIRRAVALCLANNLIRVGRALRARHRAILAD